MKDDGNASREAFNADAYWEKTAASTEQQLEEFLAEAEKYEVAPFVRSICTQLFDHGNPEKLIGWQAELLIEAASELVFCAKSQLEGRS